MQETQLNGESLDIVSENVSKLKELFPEIVTEDKIDFDKLKEVLGKYTEDDNERYNFTWKGKSAALRLAQTPSTGTLRPCKEESKNWDTTENLYIEGDNLEVLKLLQKSYYGKIKMIYIDPPYNTGKDFVYQDDYHDNIKNYLQLTQQVNSEGKKLSTNLDTSGRFHTNWLNMIYPRLRLARNLLSEDGIIFISIDDNEVNNLKEICNLVFNENNFIAQIVVEGTPKNDPYIVSTAHEYCLVYVKNFEKAKNANYGITNPLYSQIISIFEKYKPDYNLVQQKIKDFYKNNKLTSDNISNYKFVDKKGIYRTGPIDDPQKSGPIDERLNPKTNKPCLTPAGGWRCNKETWNKWIENNLIVFPENNNILPSKKTYIGEGRLDVMKAYFKIQTRKDTDFLKNLFGLKMTPFSNPKPKDLIKTFIKNCNDDEFILLDFFAGSGTSAQALFEINRETFGNRKFILVQLPELLSIKNGQSNKEKKIIKSAIEFLSNEKKPLNISEITKERIRRVGDILLSEMDQNGQTSLDSKSKTKLDIGFKVFKLDSSNLSKWDPEYDNLEQTLLDSVENLVPSRNELDLVYEIMLKYGIDLTLPIEEYQTQDKKFYSIGFGALVICLDDNLTSNLASEIIRLKNKLSPEFMRVVFKDNGFASDSDKTNIKETLKTNGIEEFVTI